jgi:4-amino-4-deoxy-L-arabinose transferase-like glycosyltransferase
VQFASNSLSNSGELTISDFVNIPMMRPEIDRNTSRSTSRRYAARYRFAVLLAIVFVCGAALYTYRATRNPAGFFVDESSIAYNAYTISQTGQDEFGNSWPLYFRAFGDYKNPVYIYLLAGLFKLTGPSILTARMLSAFAGVIAALLLGVLAARVSRSREGGIVVAGSALLTPWLFEVSRVSMEVALYPLVLILFLLAVHRASTKLKWSWANVLAVAATLALLTYTYSVGRVLAPLLALGLGFLITRKRFAGILQTWVLYALTLIPLIVFQRNHDDALTGRFKLISYVTPESSTLEIAWAFLKHYAGNLSPRSLLWSGDPNIYQVAHIANTPALLAATFVLILMGVWLVVRDHRSEPWWRFVLFGFVVSAVPASLTLDYFHMLRLVPMLVFLLLLMAPAVAKLATNEKRRWYKPVLVVLILLTLAQGATFQWRYHAAADSPWRLHLFDAAFPRVIFAAALAQPSRPIFLADPAPTAYIQSYWYAVLNRVPISDLSLLKLDEAPPIGAVVISTETACDRPRVLAHTEPYTLYVVDRKPWLRVPLPESAMRAEISVSDLPAITNAGEDVRIKVHVQNRGDTLWPGCERSAGAMQVSLGGRWLNGAGQKFSAAEGRTPLPADVAPSREADLTFAIHAPTQPGEYLLELGMLQEGVAWFGLKGSKTWRGVVKVR